MVPSGYGSERSPCVSDDVVPRKAAACVTLSAINKTSPCYDGACRRFTGKRHGRLRFPSPSGNIPAINSVHTAAVGYPTKHIQVSGRLREAIARNGYRIWCNYIPRPGCATWTARRRRRRCTTDWRGCWCRSYRWGWRWAGWREIDIALSASRSASRAIAEVLSKERVVSLHSGCGRCVAVTHCAVDHVKARLPLVQPQLEAGTTASREVLRAPFDVENAAGSSAAYRCKDTEPTVNQI